MSSAARSTFTLRVAQDRLGLSRPVRTGLINAGFVNPSRGARNEHRFTFQDLALLRTAHALQQSNIAPRKILESLAKLRASLPAQLPLTGLRITVVGADVAVRDRTGKLEAAASGQYLMDFEVSDEGGKLSFLDSAGGAEAPGREASSARALFLKAEQLESKDQPAAIRVYRSAIEIDPSFADAYLNLGAMLCEAQQFDAALRLYDGAIAVCPESSLIRFNHGVVLEDLGRIEDASKTQSPATMSACGSILLSEARISTSPA